jgi:RNA polymerase subunit RPABC4/transcription elongation factor Spt4
VLEEASPKKFGWICPKCFRVFSPSISICPFCMSKGETTNETCNYKWEEISIFDPEVQQVRILRRCVKCGLLIV